MSKALFTALICLSLSTISVAYASSLLPCPDLQAAFLEAGQIENPSTSYWEMWQLARTKPPRLPPAHRYEWLRRTYDRLLECPSDDLGWLGAHLHNAIQMGVEMEAAASAMGQYGKAYMAVQEAELFSTRLWNGPPRPERGHGSETAWGVTINLALDRAIHYERRGLVAEAETEYRLVMAMLDRLRDANHRLYQERRALNNWSVLMGRAGRGITKEHLRQQGRALSGGEDAHLETNQIMEEIMNEPATPQHVADLKRMADQRELEGRWESALQIRRRAAWVYHRMEEHDAAWALFAEVEKAARQHGFFMALAQTLHARADARSEVQDFEVAEQDYQQALTAYRRSGFKLEEIRLYHDYARHLQRRGQHADALRMIGESVRLAETLQLRELLPRRWALQASILASLGRVNEAEALWQQNVALLEELTEILPRIRFQVMTARLYFLEQYGTPEAFEAYYQIAHAYAESEGLSDYVRRHFLRLEHSPEATPDRAEEQVPMIWGDIQPRLVVTPHDEGGTARAWFWVLNDSGWPVDGALALSEAGSVEWVEREGLLIGRAGSQHEAASVTEVWSGSIAAQGHLPVLLESVGVEGASPVRTLRWTDEWGEVDAIWRIDDEASAETPMITVQMAWSIWNPFFAVPIYHVWPTHLEAQHVVFRIRTSQPSRVEIYNATMSVLLAVDAQGDGAFTGTGDVLSDSGGTAYPRAVPGSSNWLRVFPLEDVDYQAYLDVQVEMATDDTEWTLIGHARIMSFGHSPP